MKKFYLFGFIILLNLVAINNAIAQSGRQKQKVITPASTELESKPPTEAPRPPRIVPIPVTGRIPVLNNSTGSGEIPDYIVYETVFRLAKTGWSAAEELKFHPLEVRVCRRYRVEKILNEKQEKVLNEISGETMLELEKLNQQARPIIEEFRAKMRSGMIVQGGERPMPPPELEEIQQNKIKLIEGAIEKLKKRLGEKDFTGLNDFVNKNLRSGMKSVNIPIP